MSISGSDSSNMSYQLTETCGGAKPKYVSCFHDDDYDNSNKITKYNTKLNVKTSVPLAINNNNNKFDVCTHDYSVNVIEGGHDANNMFDMCDVRNILNSIMLDLLTTSNKSNIGVNDDTIDGSDFGHSPCGKAPGEVMEHYII